MTASSPISINSTTATEAFIPLSVPMLSGNEWAYVKECLDTNWVSSAGPFVDRFERAMAEYVGTAHAVATVNGTAALHVALMLAGVGPDDEVLVSSLTFVAPANTIRYVGAWPVFIDADPTYWQMDPAKVERFLESECVMRDAVLMNLTSGRRVKAIIPVHILGGACDLDPILAVARRFGLTVIEDATEGLGAKYKGKSLGGLADLGCFSYNGNKIITTGGGGMLTTNNVQWARRGKHLTTQAKSDSIEYVHDEIGYNYRLTNVQAAIGVAQLENLDKYIAAKRRIARMYDEALVDLLGVTLPREAPWSFSTFWLYTVLIDDTVARLDSRRMMHQLAARGIQTRPLWAPIHEQQPYRSCQAYEIDVADRLYRTALSLPCSAGLTASEQDRVVSAVRNLLS